MSNLSDICTGNQILFKTLKRALLRKKCVKIIRPNQESKILTVKGYGKCNNYHYSHFAGLEACSVCGKQMSRLKCIKGLLLLNCFYQLPLMF